MNHCVESRGPDAVFAALLDEGRFAIQRCDGCAHHFFVPRLLCPRCGSSAHSWVDVQGDGVVHATTVLHRAAPDGALNIALVDLLEGPRMLTRVEGLSPDQVHIGLRVRATITRGPGGAPLLVFEPREGGR